MKYVSYIDDAIKTANVITISVAPENSPKGRLGFCTLNNEPTGNCQLALVRYANILFNKYYYPIIIGPLIRNLAKKLIMVDIRSELVNTMKELIGNKDAILMEQSYSSTSGNKMTIVIIIAEKINNYNAYKTGLMK